MSCLAKIKLIKKQKKALMIYIKKQTSGSVYSSGSTPPPAHEKIASLYGRAMESLHDPQVLETCLVPLGLCAGDALACQQMTPLLQALKERSFSLISKPNVDTGIYFLQDAHNQDIGVFKLGRKRAAIELLVRKVAHLTGLGEHTTAGLFCAVKDFEGGGIEDEDELITETLWNGFTKIYCERPSDEESECSDDLDTRQTSLFFESADESESCEIPESVDKAHKVVVGILEPYLPHPQTEAPLLEFTRMTLLSLIVGLRDAKKSGYSGSVQFDVEDSFPLWIDPPNAGECPAATDLRYLTDDLRAQTPLNPGDLRSLAALVSRWDIDALIGQLSQETIAYPDAFVEEEDEADDDCVFEDGEGNYACLETRDSHPINGVLDLWHNNPERKILKEQQLEALRLRMSRAKECILTAAQSFCLLAPIDLVFAVDPRARQLAEEIIRSPSENIQRELWAELSPLGAAGIFNPKRYRGSPIEASSPTTPLFMTTSFHRQLGQQNEISSRQ
jgi:hypothetical protein